jgi:hypothetical protein
MSNLIAREKLNIVEIETDEQDARPPAFSDEALALRFADLHADDLRYVAAWGKWLRRLRRLVTGAFQRGKRARALRRH